ncbi:MAG: hypothetical protein J5858_03765 [Lentisphaeria bacterium]|nr:hypothetical protein [Lentisphaeria bacterium]
MLKERICRRLYYYWEILNTRLFKIKCLALWFVFEKYYYSGILFKRYRIEDIKLYHFRGWHNGTSTFIGKCQGKNVFIKRSIFKDAVDSEINCINRLNACGSKKFFETCEILGTIHSGRQHMVIESFIEGVSLASALPTLSGEDISGIMLKLCDIVEFFREIKFIHCDFTPGNIFLSRGALYLIDFEFSTFTDQSTYNKRLLSLPREKIKSLGGVYSLRNGMIDDSYSLVQMINRHCPSFSVLHKDVWISLNLGIQKNSITPKAIQ